MSYKHPGRSPLWAILLLLCLPVTGVADDAHPLDPLDLSSPRATLNDFLTASDAFFSLLRDEEHWQAPSRATAYRLSDALTPLERTLDLSEIPPASRRDLGRDGVVYLYEVLSRIELPPEADIPGAAAFADNKSASWTIPHTEITLLRSADGPRAGQFLFSSSTVLRAEEFYEKVRTLAYRRDVPLKNYAEMRPYLSTGGWLISSHTIEGFVRLSLTGHKQLLAQRPSVGCFIDSFSAYTARAAIRPVMSKPTNPVRTATTRPAGVTGAISP